ncbi:MAG: hypothetical protein Q9162_005733 [Coniocarpon cinnabarinum]
MFNRRLSQKPSSDFLSNFKRQYSGVLPAQPEQALQTGLITSPSTCQTPKLAFDPKYVIFFGALTGTTLRFEGYSGRNNGQFTSGSLELPSEFKTSGYLDADVDGFHDVNHVGGFWPPTPQGSAQFAGGPDPFQHQPGILGLDTPVSAGTHYHGFPPSQHTFHTPEFLPSQRVNSFGTAQQQFQPPPGMAAHAFGQAAPHFNHADVQTHGLRLSDVSLTQGYDQHPPASATRTRPPAALENLGPRSVMEAMNQFRFRTILKAQTAMIKHPQDVPVTYLNKSQVYTIRVEDSLLREAVVDPSLKYRTAIRISFEDDQQRKNPATSWQLWNEGRGTNEALKRGVKPRAVEYVNPDQSQTEARSNLHPVVENFDGFSVIWSPASDGTASCNIQLRFNFLSTDFSHSKGVKGVPVRLCAKTELFEGTHLFASSAVHRDISYCAVKIFRDHGAERKLANDRTHIDKLIDKFTTQAEQADTCVKEGGKRRRSDSVLTSRPSKIAKHKRGWSVSSSDSGDEQDPTEDEITVRIRSLKAMPDSIRPVSAFYLRGDERDDLDTHPMPPLADTPPTRSPARAGPPALKTDTAATTSVSTGTFGSETPASASPRLMRAKSDLTANVPHSLETTPSRPGKSPVKQEVHRSTPQQLASPPSSGAMKPRKSDQLTVTAPSVPQIKQALDVDTTYQAPRERTPQAVAEFFIKPSFSWKQTRDDNYRAIYLYERSLHDLVHAIASKCGIDPAAIVSTVRINQQELVITAEDEMVQQMPERQSLLAELDIAEDTHNSAAQFFESHDDDFEDIGTRYKLKLRY